jgi:hypothetical protein
MEPEDSLSFSQQSTPDSILTGLIQSTPLHLFSLRTGFNIFSRLYTNIFKTNIMYTLLMGPMLHKELHLHFHPWEGNIKAT